jgi:hypothetical protein
MTSKEAVSNLFLFLTIDLSHHDFPMLHSLGIN